MCMSICLIGTGAAFVSGASALARAPAWAIKN